MSISNQIKCGYALGHIAKVHTPEIERVWCELKTYVKTTDYLNENHLGLSISYQIVVDKD